MVSMVNIWSSRILANLIRMMNLVPTLNHGATVEVWEWISNLAPHFNGHTIDYPWRDKIYSMSVKGVSGCVLCVQSLTFLPPSLPLELSAFLSYYLHKQPPAGGMAFCLTLYLMNNHARVLYFCLVFMHAWIMSMVILALQMGAVSI